MKCSDIKDLFSQHADTDSDLTKNPDFVRHISECVQCRSDYEKHIRLIQALKKGFNDFTPWPDRQFKFKFPAHQTQKESVADIISRFIMSSWKPAATLAFACIILLLFYSGSPEAPVFDFYLKTGKLSDVAAKTQTYGGKLSSSTFIADVESQICYNLSNSSGSPSYFQSKVAPGSQFITGKHEITLEAGALWITHHDAPLKIAIPGARINIIGTEFLLATHEKASLIRLIDGKIELIDSKGVVEIKSGKNYLYTKEQGTFIDISESLQTTWDTLASSPATAFEPLRPTTDRQVPVQKQTPDKSPDQPTNGSFTPPPETFAPASETVNMDENPSESTFDNNQEFNNPVEGLGN